jgi:hypothetical protein
MERHYDLVGLLFVVYGVLLAVLAAVLLIVVGPGDASPGDVSAAPSSFWTSLAYQSPYAALVLLVLAVPFILTGLGLRRRNGWARVAAMVLGAISLLSFPVGTALGAYTLWTLTRPDAATAFS